MSAWTAGGFPFGFRFKKPRDVFHTICCAMAERSVNADQSDTTDSNILYRPACHALEYPPNPFDEKTDLSLGRVYNTMDVFEFMRNRIMDIACCYCDPDKAYDFDNYPDLEHWTPESLEDKLKEHYVKFSPFCDKEKYLMFIYRVLNLCTVRRVPVRSEYGTARYRNAGAINLYYADIERIKKVMTDKQFTLASSPTHRFSVWTNSVKDYSMEQYGIRFFTWIDDLRPCDTTFYGFAEDTYDVFSAPAGLNIKKNSWFCAGVPDHVEDYNGVKRLVLELEAADVDIRDIPEIPRDSTWRSGFSLKYFKNSNLNSCFGYAVRDQRKYLKYIER